MTLHKQIREVHQKKYSLVKHMKTNSESIYYWKEYKEYTVNHRNVHEMNLKWYSLGDLEEEVFVSKLPCSQAANCYNARILPSQY